jgi:hypothetical protein
VFVSWPHERIADIAMRILGKKPIRHWPANRFDVVWVFSPPASETGHWDLAQVAQELLDGDQDSVLS